MSRGADAAAGGGHGTAEDPLIHEWNRPAPARGPVGVVDETLRDGLQGGVPRMPSIEERLRLIGLSASLGVEELTIGFPAHEKACEDVLALCRGVQERGLPVRLGVLGRTLAKDIERIAQIRDSTGAAVVAWLFVGASTIRRVAEDWDLEWLEQTAGDGLSRARSLGLEVNFGLEDAARTPPDVLAELIGIAVGHGVRTLSVCDTVGHLTPSGAREIIGFARETLAGLGSQMRLDFHNHRDRGLALAAALAAVEAGVDRVHATLFGIGERAGNCPLGLLLVNLRMLGLWEHELLALPEYAAQLVTACNLDVPVHYPVLGENAFRTQAGVHAAAIVKARARGREDAAARVYSSVDPGIVGRVLDVEVGPASGRANVRMALERLRLTLDDAGVDALLERARVEGRVLGDEELRRLCARP